MSDFKFIRTREVKAPTRANNDDAGVDLFCSTNLSEEEIRKSLILAYDYRKSRIESLYELMRYYNLNHMSEKVLEFEPLYVEKTFDDLFVSRFVYDYGFHSEVYPLLDKPFHKMDEGVGYNYGCHSTLTER